MAMSLKHECSENTHPLVPKPGFFRGQTLNIEALDYSADISLGGGDSVKQNKNCPSNNRDI